MIDRDGLRALSGRRILALVVIVAAMGPLALNIFVPSIPRLQQVFATGFSTVQLTLSLFLVGLAFGQLTYGPLSDRFGRRHALLFGIVLYVMASVLCLWAPSIEILALGRFLQAFGGCAGIVLGRAMVRDLFDREQTARMLALATMAIVVVQMASPMLGGLLDHWFGWRASFAFILATGIGVMLAVMRWLPETHSAERRELSMGNSVLGGLGALTRHRKFVGYVLQVGFTTGNFICVLAGAPYVVVELMGGTPATYAMFFALPAAGYIAGNYATSRLAGRLSIDRAIAVGTTISLAGIAALVLLWALWGLPEPLLLFAPLVVVSFGNGLAVPNGIAGAISVDPRFAGAAAGIAGFLQMGIGAILSHVMGLLLDDTALPMIALMLFSAAAAWIAHKVAGHGHKNRAKQV